MDGLPAHLPAERLDAEIVVLGTSDVRAAERAEQAALIETADGPVQARPGDYIVSMPNGERYPVLPAIYLGTYEIISVVGRWHIGRRLRHPRRAWPVKSAAVDFDYGIGRGVVTAPRGAWIYQSGDEDYGVINESAQQTSYAVVGNAAEVTSRDWHALFSRLSTAVIWMPPVLIGMSLLALGFEELTDALLVAEVVLLLLGAGAVWWSRRQDWALKAALVAGQHMARAYQVAVAALGLPTSERFPMLALWRAAQDDPPVPARPDATRLRGVKDLVDHSVQELREEAESHHRMARLTSTLPWVAACVMLAGVPVLLATHHLGLKLFLIWLPSLLGAAHAWHWHHQVEQRAMAVQELARMLRFVKTRLVALAPRDDEPYPDATRDGELVAALRLLCLCVARHTQTELCMAAAEEAPVPV